MAISEIQEILIDWLKKRTGVSMHGADNFLASGQLDSFDVVRLVGFCESQFGIELSTADLESEKFPTIEGLAQIIESHIVTGRA